MNNNHPGIGAHTAHNKTVKHHVIEKIKYTLNTFHSTREMADAVLENTYSYTSESLFSRSFLWKSVFILDAFESREIKARSGSTFSQNDLNLSNLRKERDNYDLLCKEFQVPWNRLQENHDYFKELQSAEDYDLTDEISKRKELARIRVTHDPLSFMNDKIDTQLEDTAKNSSSRHKVRELSDLDLLELLITDVERLFPQLPEYFIQNQENKKMIIEVLYIWSKLNHIQYSQGLHEMAGVIFMILFDESINPNKIYKRKKNVILDTSSSKDDRGGVVNLDSLDAKIVELNNITYLKHDTFAIFNSFINLVISKYYDDVSLLQQCIKFDLKLHQLDQFSYILLKNKLKLDSTIWLLRYFRMILIREIKLGNSFELWDRLIAFGYTKREPNGAQLNITLLLPYIIILLLSLIKKSLITSDYGEAIYLLLHYPIIDSLEDRKQKSKNSYSTSVIVFNGDDESDNDDVRDDGIEDLDFMYVEEPIFSRFSNEKTSKFSSDANRSNDLQDDMEGEADCVTLNIPELVNDAIVLYNLNKKEGDIQFIQQGTKIIEKYSGMQNGYDNKGEVSTSPLKRPLFQRNRSDSNRSSKSGNSSNHLFSSHLNGSGSSINSVTEPSTGSSFFKSLLSRKTSSSKSPRTEISDPLTSTPGAIKMHSIPNLGVSEEHHEVETKTTNAKEAEDFIIGDDLNIQFKKLSATGATNQNKAPKDFQRTRLELRLQKRVNEVMNTKN